MQVFPVINCESLECVVTRLREAKEFSEWVHVDITDGKFAPTVTWGTPEEWQKLLSAEEFKDIKIELHLMVEAPEMVLDAWLRVGANPIRGKNPLRALATSNGARRIIVHLETMTDSVYILEKCKKYGAEVVLAIAPKTEVERLLAYNHDFKYFQVLAVFPGLQGQKFQEEAIAKIKFIRDKIPGAIIEVDGGMNLETAKLVKDVGADIIVSSSYIFSTEGGSVSGGESEASRDRFRSLINL
jgi:ribulose-phosphate 3-epimerase